jgi:glycosyltransferase involved in cell wall biosynthesis
VFIPVLPSLKKKGRLKGSRNWTIDNIPLKNRHITRVRDTVQDALLVVLIIKVNDLNDELIKDKGNAYYIAFLARFKILKDPITLVKALSWLKKEINEWHDTILKEYRSL